MHNLHVFLRARHGEAERNVGATIAVSLVMMVLQIGGGNALEAQGDGLVDWHLWRLGCGHFGAIVCVETASARDAEDYRTKIAALAPLSHLTVEVVRRTSAA